MQSCPSCRRTHVLQPLHHRRHRPRAPLQPRPVRARLQPRPLHLCQQSSSDPHLPLCPHRPLPPPRQRRVAALLRSWHQRRLRCTVVSADSRKWRKGLFECLASIGSERRQPSAGWVPCPAAAKHLQHRARFMHARIFACSWSCPGSIGRCARAACNQWGVHCCAAAFSTHLVMFPLPALADDPCSSEAPPEIEPDPTAPRWLPARSLRPRTRACPSPSPEESS